MNAKRWFLFSLITAIFLFIFIGVHQQRAEATPPPASLLCTYLKFNCIPGAVPSAPINLTATAASQTQINLAWTDTSTNEDGFLIEARRIVPLPVQEKFIKIGDVGANVTTFQHTGLNPGDCYIYRVQAYNSVGRSDYSNEASACTQAPAPPPPPAPASLAAAPICPNSIVLTWVRAGSGEDGFKIQRHAGNGNFQEIASVGANILTYTDTNLALSTTYTYRVFSYNANGNSAFSNEASATTCGVPPAAPVLSATGVSQSQINASWTDPNPNETGHRIESRLETAQVFVPLTTLGVDITSYSNTGLQPATRYCYRVLAFNAFGESPWSNVACATTLSPVTPPTPPDNLNAISRCSSTINGVILTWNDKSNNEDSFEIQRRTGSGSYGNLAQAPANTTIFTDTAVTANTTYVYQIRSRNTAGVSAYSNEATVTAVANPTFPCPPTELTATAIAVDRINLTWQDNSSDETGFKLERKRQGEVAFTEFRSVGANVIFYSDWGLTPDTEYTYRVRTYNGNGNSPYSNEATARTFPLMQKPTCPTNVTASAVSPTQVNVTWTDASNNEMGFKIFRRIGSEVAIAIGNTLPGTGSFTDNGVAPGTTYAYRVVPYNLAGDGVDCPEATVTTPGGGSPPSAPINLTATAVSTSQINLNWTDTSSNELGFEIEAHGPGGSFARVGTVGANVTTFSHTGLNPSTTYTYRVRAFNAVGPSGYSNEASATTHALPSLPPCPGSLQAVALSDSEIRLRWGDLSTNELGFVIERRAPTINGEGNPAPTGDEFVEIARVGAGVTTYTDSGLLPLTQYTYRIRSFNAAGVSDCPATVSATTLGEETPCIGSAEIPDLGGPTPTPEPDPGFSPTPDPFMTPSPTPIPTVDPSNTPSPSPSPSNTPGPSPSGTPSPSPSPTGTSGPPATPPPGGWLIPTSNLLAFNQIEQSISQYYAALTPLTEKHFAFKAFHFSQPASATFASLTTGCVVG